MQRKLLFPTFAVIALISIGAFGCPTSGQPPSREPPPDPSAVLGACENASRLGCLAEPTTDVCVTNWTRDSQIRAIDFECIHGAQSVDTMRLCSHGFVRCRK